ncbi:MAG: AsmA family protein [Tatlockia sp.]|nr:AsmA family protein [Tatlockia sp.]
MIVFKKLLALVIVVVLLAMITLWILAEWVKPEVLRHYINSHFSALTHQKSEVEGEITWQIFPRPGIKVTKIRIGDDSNPSHYSAKLENLHFNLKITPLLRGKLVFNDLMVDGFTVNVNPGLASAPLTTQNTPVKFQAKTEDQTKLSEQFAIERFLLSHGQINIVENTRVVSFSGLQIGGEQFNLQRRLFPFQFKSNFEITKDKQQIIKAQVNFKGSTSLSPLVFSNPFTILQNTPLDGVISLQNVKIKQLKIAKISAHTKTKPGVFVFNPLTFSLYHGESVGDLSYEFASKKLNINQTATNLDSSKFIKDLLNKSLFKGSLDLSLHAQANLDNPNWLDSTTGYGSFTIKNGVIELINLNKVINDTSDKINLLFAGDTIKKEPSLELGQFYNPEFFKGGTNFKLLTFQYQLKDARMSSNSLILQTDKLQIKGDGNLNLKDESLSANLFAKVTELDSGMGKIQHSLGGSFPIIIGGTLKDPSALPDLQKINPLLTKIWFRAALTKPVKKIGNTLKIILENGQKFL